MNVVLVAFVLVVLAIPFAGAWMQSHVHLLNDCQQSIDNSITIEGHPTTRWLPPSVHCTYDDTFAAPELASRVPAPENEIAIAGTFVAAILAVPILLLFGGVTKLVTRGIGSVRARRLHRTRAAL